MALVIVLASSIQFVLSNYHVMNLRPVRIMEALGAVTSVYLERDSTIKRRRISSRILHLVNCITGFVIFSYYTGVLTSLMTSSPASVDIKSLAVIEIIYFELKKQESVLS